MTTCLKKSTGQKILKEGKKFGFYSCQDRKSLEHFKKGRDIIYIKKKKKPYDVPYFG